LVEIACANESGTFDPAGITNALGSRTSVTVPWTGLEVWLVTDDGEPGSAGLVASEDCAKDDGARAIPETSSIESTTRIEHLPEARLASG
jgi:hypothetical protein